MLRCMMIDPKKSTVHSNCRKFIKKECLALHKPPAIDLDVITKRIQSKTTPCPIHTKLSCFKSMPGPKLL